VLVNYTNVVTEFIGIAGSMHLFTSEVCFCAAVRGLVWYMVVRGSYKSTEKIFLVASRCISHTFLRACYRSRTGTMRCWPLCTAAGLCGATRRICTWLSRGGDHDRSVDAVLPAVVDCGEGIRVKDYAASRLDVIIAAWFTDIVRGSSLWPVRHAFGMGWGNSVGVRRGRGDAAAAGITFVLFALGCSTHRCLRVILPLSTAYTVCEGWFESAWTRASRKRHFLYWLTRCLIAAGR